MCSMAMPQHSLFDMPYSRFITLTETVIVSGSIWNLHGCRFTAEGAKRAASRDTLIQFGHSDSSSPVTNPDNFLRRCQADQVNHRHKAEAAF